MPAPPLLLLRNDDSTYRGVLGEPIVSNPYLSPDVDARRIMTRVAGAVESVIRQEPAQWFNFYRNWPCEAP